MAQSSSQRTPRLGKNSLDQLLKYTKAIMDVHSRNTEWYCKLEYIDIAYARYKYYQRMTGGVDRSTADIECGLNLDEITIPVVVSQVDTYVGYLADIFLSGYPIFPVVSTPESYKEAEAFQSIIEEHAVRSRYARQFLMNFYDGIKYNLTAAEIAWHQIDTYSYPSALDLLNPDPQAPKPQGLSINRIKRLDPYNLIYDRRVEPADVPYCGTYAGYVEVLPEIELKRKLIQYQKTGFGYYTNQAFTAGYGAIAAPFAIGHYKEKPQISNYISRQSLQNGSLMDWDSYMLGKQNSKVRGNYSDMFTHTTLYCRLIPANLGITGPGNDIPQVWKICIVNDTYVVYAAREYTIYDMLPIIIAQPREDGFGMQTNSVGESAIDFQEGASKLFGIRLNSARRAVMDRAIYDPDMINPSHLNSPIPAPKIPLRDRSQIAGKTIEQAYKQIPFDSRGTETVINDLATLLGLAETVNGTNKPIQGQFQKGNKSRKEWEDTMGGAHNRLRLPALSYEIQFFLPLKEQIKLNIFQHPGEIEGTYQNPGNGDIYEVNMEMIEQIKKKVKQFKIADGMLPSDKIAASDVLQFGFQTIQNSPILQQHYGPALPYIFAHMMQMGGVMGFDQYTQMALRMQQQGQANGQLPAPANPTAPAQE